MCYIVRGPFSRWSGIEPNQSAMLPETLLRNCKVWDLRLTIHSAPQPRRGAVSILFNNTTTEADFSVINNHRLASVYGLRMFELQLGGSVIK